MIRLVIVGCFLCFLSLSFNAQAQKFNFKADVDKVEESGFCTILLNPEVRVKMTEEGHDIRLYQGSTEIPYIQVEDPSMQEHQLFVPYEIVSIEHMKQKRYTRIVIHNSGKTKINNIVLRVQNADVRKYLKLNASNDKENWYVLKDHYAYNSISNTQETSEIRVLNFPLSDYSYYEILIDDYYDKPIQVLEAGYYNRVVESGHYISVPVDAFLQHDSLKESIIKIPLKGHYFDRMAITIDAPKYYLREAEMYVLKEVEENAKKFRIPQVLGSIKLISNSSNVFNFRNLKADTLFLRIQNFDDAALEIQKIEFYQLNHYLIADLERELDYQVRFSDEKAKAPIYDIRYFKDKIPDELNSVNLSNITEIEYDEEEEFVDEKNFNLSDYWLWIVIVFVVGLLGYMSYKMVLDNKRNE